MTTAPARNAQTAALEALIEAHAIELKLPTVRRRFKALAAEALREQQTPVAYLGALLEAEMAERAERREKRRLIDARFPQIKRMEDFRFADNPKVPQATIAALAEGSWIDDRESVIFIGDSGTGKTMLATALAVCACHQGRRVRFTTLAGLANELQEAQGNRELGRVIGRYARTELLVCDELGYLALPDGAADWRKRSSTGSLTEHTSSTPATRAGDSDTAWNAKPGKEPDPLPEGAHAPIAAARRATRAGPRRPARLAFYLPIRQHQHQQQPTPGGATSTHRAGATAGHRFHMTRITIRRWPIRQAALWAVFAVAGGSALGASGWSSAADAHGPVTAIRAAASSATRSVRVDGYSVTTKCIGRATGSTPTIVLLAGEGDPLSRFSRIQSKLSSLTRVCSYDRIGEGTSSRPRSDQTLADSAAILHELLAKLHVTSHGVVLVGHSLGGLIGARYASIYHSQVKALVLLDASPPSVEARIQQLIPSGATGLAGEVRREIKGLASGHNAERLVFTDKPLPSIGSIPLTVVQHGVKIYAAVPKYGKALQEIWSDGQQQWLALSSHSRMVIAKKSGHYIYLNQPNLTLRLIKQALSEGEAHA